MAYTIPSDHPLGSIDVEYDQLDYYLRKNNPDILRTLCASLRADPATTCERRYLAHLFEGLVLLAEGRTGEGCSELYTALAGPPYIHVRAVSALALQRMGDGDLEAAAELMKPLVSQNPPSPHFHMALGMYRGRTGDAAEEWASYGRALDLDPNFFPALWSIRVLGLAPEHRQEFKARLLRFLDNEPENGDVRTHLAACLLAQGEVVESWGEIQRIVSFLEVAPVTDPTLELLQELAKAVASRQGGGMHG